VQDEVERRVGGRPNFISREPKEDGVLVILQNQIQRDKTLEINGFLVLNHPIWIVKSPEPFEGFRPVLSRVFQTNASDGIVDLGSLAQKVTDAGGDGNAVKLNNRDFVEFLLFRLGTEARDERFWVQTLVLCDNEIEAIDPWSPFLHFLPHLRVINVTENNITQKPDLSEWQQLKVVWQPRVQKVEKPSRGGKWA
jgi:hypothetical protein